MTSAASPAAAAHVSLVTLGVRDLGLATSFYEALGWQRSSASVDGEIAFLTGGALVLGLYGWDDLATDAAVPPAGSGFRGVALATNLGSREAVDDAMAVAAAAGGTVLAPPHAAEWGGYSGYFADPDGHLWELAHNPGFTLGPDGAIALPD